jgi:tRNA-dihydrouridine synthase B
MAGVTDRPFRALCRRFGAGLTTSEMTTADTSLWQSAKSRYRLNLDLDSEPVAVQIAGADPVQMADAARAVVARGAQIVDINMGCPAKKVCKKLAGSALLRDEALVTRIIDAVVAAVDVPVTLKTRTGWDPAHRNGVRIARIAEDSGIAALAIHGRTRACRYHCAAEYETIAKIKSTVAIPVIANGDITSPEKSLEVLRLTGADGLMIGRGAQGRPWIFKELATLSYAAVRKTPIEKKEAPVEKNELRDIILGHLSDLHRFYGDATGVRVARKHLTWYCDQLENAAEFRYRVVRVDNASEQIRLTMEYLDTYVGGISKAA